MESISRNVLHVSCCMLAVIGFSMSCITLEVQGADCDVITVKVDIDSYGNAGPDDTHPGWESWEMSAYYGPFGPVEKDFGEVTVTIDGVTVAGGSGELGGSRNRLSVDVGDITDFSRMYKDLVLVPLTSDGMGLDYIEVTFAFDPDCANRAYEFTFWTWDPVFAGSGLEGFPGSGEPPESKFVAWSTVNPSTWLASNWPDPSGYHISNGIDSNMPAGLAALVTGVALEHGTASWLSGSDDADGMTYSATMVGVLDEYGKITYYGWVDMTDMTGNQHLSLNGFAITVPRPDGILKADFTDDGVVDYRDLEIMRNEWFNMSCCETDLYKDFTIDFKDFAILADMWLESKS